MNLAEMVYSPQAFRRHLLIDTDAGPKPLAKVADAWQLKDFEALDSAWERVARRGDRPAVNRAYLERPRAHDKTGCMAVMTAWALLASPRKLAGVAAAADKDQARLLRDAIEKLLRLNKWLAEILEVQAYRVINKHKDSGSTLEIMAANVPGSWGITPDFIVVDELTHWTDAAEHFWISLLSSAAKRASCLLVVISNAGVGQGTSWQWKIREAARESPDWYFSRIDCQASWISGKLLDEQRRMLPAIAFDRLWLNRWVSSSGDAIPEADILAALGDPVRHEPPADTGCNLLYLAGLDLGIKRDASALVVLGKEPEGERLKLVRLNVWKAKPGERVSIAAIEAEIAKVHSQYNLQRLSYDPWQAEYLAERLSALGIPTREVTFSLKSHQAMASAMIEAFSERKIELWEDAGLLTDIRSLRIELKANSYRLTAARTVTGHADRAVALALAILDSADVRELNYIRTADVDDMSDQEMRDILGDLDEDRPQRGWQSETWEGDACH